MALLQDKIVLVTGAGAGIGRAIALAMAETARSSPPPPTRRGACGADAPPREAAGDARRAIAIEADCGDIASIDRMWRAPSPSSAGST